MGDELHRFRKVLRHQVAELELVIAFVGLREGHGCRAGGERNGLAVEVVNRLDAARLPDGCGDLNAEVAHREGSFLLTLQRIGGRAAFDIDGAVLDERDAVGRSDRLILDVKLREAEFLLDGIRNALADREGIACRLAVGVEVGERNRTFAVAERNGAGFLNFFERARKLSRAHGGAGGEKTCGSDDGCAAGNLEHIWLLISEWSLGMLQVPYAYRGEPVITIEAIAVPKVGSAGNEVHK